MEIEEMFPYIVSRRRLMVTSHTADFRVLQLTSVSEFQGGG